MIDIHITNLDFCTCAALGMPEFDYDFQVYCHNKKTDKIWRGACRRKALQKCVELGMKELNRIMS